MEYRLIINIEGEDKEVLVPDLATAELLLNDQDAAYAYYNANYGQRSNDETQPVEEGEEEAVPSTSEGVIWVKRKPTTTDMEATQLLLRMRDEKRRQFDDKKSNKKQLWASIAEALEKENYFLGANGGERCRQKFSNLTKCYLKYVRHQKTTGSQYMEQPCFFDEMHSLLGEKHKTAPKHLVDTMEIENCELTEEAVPQQRQQEGDATQQSPSCSFSQPPPQDRFRSLREAASPKTSKGDRVLQEIQLQNREQQRQFGVLEAHMSKTEQQRDRLISVLENYFSTKKRKREDEDE